MLLLWFRFDLTDRLLVLSDNPTVSTLISYHPKSRMASSTESFSMMHGESVNPAREHITSQHDTDSPYALSNGPWSFLARHGHVPQEEGLPTGVPIESFPMLEPSVLSAPYVTLSRVGLNLLFLCPPYFHKKLQIFVSMQDEQK